MNREKKKKNVSVHVYVCVKQEGGRHLPFVYDTMHPSIVSSLSQVSMCFPSAMGRTTAVGR